MKRWAWVELNEHGTCEMHECRFGHDVKDPRYEARAAALLNVARLADEMDKILLEDIGKGSICHDALDALREVWRDWNKE